MKLVTSQLHQAPGFSDQDQGQDIDIQTTILRPSQVGSQDLMKSHLTFRLLLSVVAIGHHTIPQGEIDRGMSFTTF